MGGGIDYEKLQEAGDFIDKMLIQGQPEQSKILGVCLKTFISKEFEDGRNFYFQGQDIREALKSYLTKDFEATYYKHTFDYERAFNDGGCLDINLYNGALFGVYLALSDQFGRRFNNKDEAKWLANRTFLVLTGNLDEVSLVADFSNSQNKFLQSEKESKVNVFEDTTVLEFGAIRIPSRRLPILERLGYTGVGDSKTGRTNSKSDGFISLENWKDKIKKDDYTYLMSANTIEIGAIQSPDLGMQNKLNAQTFAVCSNVVRKGGKIFHMVDSNLSGCFYSSDFHDLCGVELIDTKLYSSRAEDNIFIFEKVSDSKITEKGFKEFYENSITIAHRLYKDRTPLQGRKTMHTPGLNSKIELY